MLTWCHYFMKKLIKYVNSGKNNNSYDQWESLKEQKSTTYACALFHDYGKCVSIPFAGLFPPNEIQFPLTENKYPSTENQFPPNENQFLPTENQFPPTENQFPLTENQFPLTENQFPQMEMVFILMSINFPFNAIIDVFLSFKVFPVMKFGELSIVNLDKNSQNLNI